jgi:putative zinc finger protein
VCDELDKAIMRRVAVILREQMVDSESDENCPDMNLLTAYVHGSVSSEERRQVDSHIGRCRKCWDAIIFVVKSLDTAPGLSHWLDEQ